jgi:hypothetical protein
MDRSSSSVRLVAGRCGQEYTVTGTEYDRASYDASRAFEAHTILNGTLKVKPQGKCDFEIVSLRRK